MDSWTQLSDQVTGGSGEGGGGGRRYSVSIIVPISASLSRQCLHCISSMVVVVVVVIESCVTIEH